MENKTIDLTKILKVGQKVWCDILGECEVAAISDAYKYPIRLKNEDYTKDGIIFCENEIFTKDGKYYTNAPQECCVIWPSKDNRSWDVFIPDKAPVIVWDNEKLYKVITFYDAINGCTFSSDGKRNYARYDNYEIIENPDQWMLDAQKQLKD